MTVKEFRHKHVKIEYVEKESQWGMFPSFIHIEHSKDFNFDSELTFNGVIKYYMAVSLAMQTKPHILYFAIDFPAGGDIKTDFVVVFFILDGKADCFAIPYNNKTGEIYNDIFPSDYKQLEEILTQFKFVTEIK
jgi:hypothetical protein